MDIEAQLPLGTYDVVVVDSHHIEPPDEPPFVTVELTVTTGEHKGELVTLRSSGHRQAALQLLGLIGTLSVEESGPRLRFD